MWRILTVIWNDAERRNFFGSHIYIYILVGAKGKALCCCSQSQVKDISEWVVILFYSVLKGWLCGTLLSPTHKSFPFQPFFFSSFLKIKREYILVWMVGRYKIKPLFFRMRKEPFSFSPFENSFVQLWGSLVHQLEFFGCPLKSTLPIIIRSEIHLVFLSSRQWV